MAHERSSSELQTVCMEVAGDCLPNVVVSLQSLSEHFRASVVSKCCRQGCGIIQGSAAINCSIVGVLCSIQFVQVLASYNCSERMLLSGWHVVPQPLMTASVYMRDVCSLSHHDL